MFSMYMIIGAPLQATNMSERRAIIGDIISSHFEEKAGARGGGGYLTNGWV